MFSSTNGSKEENDEKYRILKSAVDQENERIDGVAKQKKEQLKEYNALIKRLTDLPKKLQYHVMVPFGKVGFMPGKIVRTNEVMMLIGDGYFVEKSTFEAVETLNRQMDTIKKVISDVEAEKKLINDQLGFAEKLFRGNSQGEEIEIREEYDEEKEAEFKRNRDKQRAIKTLKPSQQTDSNADIMKRLEELELLEKTNNELEEEEEEEKMHPPPGVSAEDFNKLLARLDDDSDDDDDDDDDDEEDDEELDSDDLPEEETRLSKPSVLKESSNVMPSSSNTGRRRSVHFADENDLTQTPNCLEVHEPQSFGLTEGTGSILRNANQPGPIDHEAIREMKKAESKPRVISGSQDAFSGVFVERQPMVVPSVSSQLDIEPSTSTEPPKRISKFKAQRKNL